MKDYFKFLEELAVGDEVLTSAHGNRTFKITGLTDDKVAISNGDLFDRKTGTQLLGRKKDGYSILELTADMKAAIEKEQKEAEVKRAREIAEQEIHNEFEYYTGQSYRKRFELTLADKQAIVDFIKKLKGF